MTEDVKQQALFYQLIMSFQAAAVQHMGQMENMFTNQIEKDLEQAKLSIDMINMIRHKTEGNRTQEETQFIDQALRDLQVLFVKEQESDTADETNK